MKYITKPKVVEAFQFTNDLIDFRIRGGLRCPEWFRDEIHKGHIQTTINHKQMRIVANYDDKVTVANLYDWVCYDGRKVYCETKEDFGERYEIQRST